MPPDLAARIAAMGRVIDPPATHALYAPLHDKEPYPGAVVTRDIAYGPDPLNVLDVFTAEAATGAPRPVLVYVHGGGFERGDKHTPGTPFADNIPLWAARNGMVGVNVNYRLAPKAQWPSGPQDIAAILAWVKACGAAAVH
jgi:triacylglycerol lipase